MSEVYESSEITEPFREAMRELAATVSVITAADGERKGGLTATAVCSLSMEPASLLVCINHLSSALPVIKDSGHFCVNLLNHDQTEIANIFAGRTGCDGQQRFDQAGEWSQSAQGIPMLDQAMANVVCELSQVVDSGTHAICIGLVKEVRLAAGSPPLIYSRQGYDTLLSVRH